MIALAATGGTTMPLSAFIVRPFGVKELQISSTAVKNKLEPLLQLDPKHRVVVSLTQTDRAEQWTAGIDFDAVHRLLLTNALDELRIQGATTEAVVKAGNIREDMFHRLVTADLVIADLSLYNPNVYYELGVRQAFRDKYTFLIRSDLTHYPFDLQTDRYFAYDLVELATDPRAVVGRLVAALRATLNSTDADSPVFKLLPQLEAEDRARFIAVPEDFREEVEWARHQLRSEHLSLMAVECEGYLWEVEGLRLIGRAQFECNFIDGARRTWERIVTRYPDDVEGNSVLSTIYQRLSDAKRSEQALSRIARTRTLTPNRLSQLRALSGRNLRATWADQWRGHDGKEKRQRAALLSPLLQRAFDAFHEAFKLDLNNAYAGLNALTMLLVQTELAQRFPEDWKSIQRRPHDANSEIEARKARIAPLLATLQLAVEADREQHQQQGRNDPWFLLLEAAVACVVSNQPEYVAQLYELAVHFAPESAEASIRASLELYSELDIGSISRDQGLGIGCIGSNVARALKVLESRRKPVTPADEGRLVLMFVGLRVDHAAASHPRFPAAAADVARERLEAAIDDEIAKAGGRHKVAFGIAAGASGGDLLFHEICRSRQIPTRLCLALRKPEYVGQYVAPAGRQWVERFAEVHRSIAEQQAQAHGGGGSPEASASPACSPARILVFGESSELPRWLEGKPLYNVGRRNNQWMLQHAIAAAQRLGPDADITLIALWDEGSHGEVGIGGINDLTRKAAMQGIKVLSIRLPGEADQQASNGAAASVAERLELPGGRPVRVA